MGKERGREKDSEPVLLREGDVIELKKGHKIYASIPERYVYENTPGSMRLTRTEVTIGEDRKGLNTDYLAGRYGVLKIALDGGGTGMGPHDIFPDGHHVTCRKLLDHGKFGEEVSFYQTGAFTAMIEEIEPVGRFKIKHSRVTTKRK